jgi:hypothetical protein
MDVRVLPMNARDSANTGEYLAVRTHNDPADDTVTLATIQRVGERAAIEKPSDPHWRVRNLVVNYPMSVETALGFATRYAEFKHIPVIFTAVDE